MQNNVGDSTPQEVARSHPVPQTGKVRMTAEDEGLRRVEEDSGVILPSTCLWTNSSGGLLQPAEADTCSLNKPTNMRSALVSFLFWLMLFSLPSQTGSLCSSLRKLLPSQQLANLHLMHTLLCHLLLLLWYILTLQTLILPT